MPRAAGAAPSPRSRRDPREDLAAALANDELLLHYQPVLDMRSGRVEAVEALVRWQHPQRGLIPPAEFIPFAESSGQIVELGRWALERACRQAGDWQRRELLVRVAVNVSARQLAAPGLLDAAALALLRSGLDPGLLELELTESVLADADGAGAVLERLRRLGVHIAIDDFGTGFSSLSYLTRFGLDTLKIDRCFVARVTVDVKVSVVVGAVIAMARGLGLRTVAEGVETAAQERLLAAHGCDRAQGYLYSPPLPAQECERWLRRRAAGNERRARQANGGGGGAEVAAEALIAVSHPWPTGAGSGGARAEVNGNRSR